VATSSGTTDGLLGAEVIAELPQRLFRLRLDDDNTIIAGLGTEAKRLGIPINVGMRVTVKRARLDPARGTILGPQSSHPLDPTSSTRKPA
jgi:translation initiation factor IF-1